jgi:hypothetical protein
VAAEHQARFGTGALEQRGERNRLRQALTPDDAPRALHRSERGFRI